MAQLHTERVRNTEKPHLGGVCGVLPTVGQWQLVEKAADGRFTEVYLARPAESAEATSASYAIKMLKRQWEADPRAVQTIRREAVAGRSISHPHLISVLSANTTAAPYYVVMPWLSGETLGKRVVDRGPLEIPEALWIGRQVADALGAMHAAGWMHGDVKPDNIFVSPEGHATLLDLGFARPSDRTQPSVEQCLTGTGHYLAPEALVPGLGLDIRSDLYSLGATLLEMLSGQPPFDGSSAAELARQHRQARPAQLDEVTRRLPADAALLLREILAKEPLRRPQSPAEVVRRLVRAEIATLGDRRSDAGDQRALNRAGRCERSGIDCPSCDNAPVSG